MAKVDKMEMKYQALKNEKFNMEKLENLKQELNNENVDKENKTNYRIKLGKINYEIEKLNAKETLTNEEVGQLNDLKEEKRALQDNQKNYNSKEQYENRNKDIDLLEGFVNNQEKIDKILSMRDKMKQEVQEMSSKKQEIDAEIAMLGKSDELIATNKKLEEAIEQAKAPNSKVTNEQYLKMVKDFESNQEKINKLAKLEVNSKKLEKMIRSKKVAVTKCNLAWKNLFRNKSWDDIHLKAVQMKENNKEENKENDKPENDKEKDEKDEIKETKTNKVQRFVRKGKDKFVDWFFEEEKEEQEQEEVKEEEEGQDLIEYDEFAQKHPRLAKIRNFFTKIKNKFSGNKEVKEEDLKPEKETESKKEPEVKKQRDAFIEELRRTVENDKGDIEKAYIEKHKKVVKEKEESER